MKGMFQFAACASVLLSTSLICQQAISEEAIKGDATRGEAAFKSACASCHNTTHEGSTVAAPGLQGVLERHDAAWLDNWIKGPENFAKEDAVAKHLIDSNKYGLKMPTLPATQDAQSRADIIAYLKTLK